MKDLKSKTVDELRRGLMNCHLDAIDVCTELARRLEEAEQLSRKYLFIAGVCLSGTDEVEAIARESLDPYEAAIKARVSYREREDAVLSAYRKVNDAEVAAKALEVFQRRFHTADRMRSVAGIVYEMVEEYRAKVKQ